jgi:hypothetical protein
MQTYSRLHIIDFHYMVWIRVNKVIDFEYFCDHNYRIMND